MGAEKQCPKGGGVGYVGGILQLFDWKAKSQKKLFFSKSNSPEQLKQKKRSDGNLPMTRLHLMDEDEIVAGSSFKGSSDYSCASSVTDEEFSVTKAPGVVARLMGLDSLPTLNFPEPYSTPLFDSQSLRDAQYRRKNPDCPHHEHQNMQTDNLHSKVNAPVRNALEPKPLKIISRPIEKFHTESLPPKSAKSIPITHHKLLSPIKSTGFISTKNAAHIMEAAAKIIDLGPQMNTKGKMSQAGSSSVPLRIRDLKEKVEAAQKPCKPAEPSRRPVEYNAAKYLKGQSMNKSCNGLVDTTSFRISSNPEECSAGLKNKGKSVSLALQAKVNVQKREGLNSSGSRNLFVQQEQSKVMSSQLFKSQPNNTQKNSHKKTSIHKNPSVLRQNNQKQNCPTERGNRAIPSKLLDSNPQGRKSHSVNSAFGQQKSSSKYAGNSKVVSRKSGLDMIESKEEVSCSSTTNVPRKKRSIDGDFHLEKNQDVGDRLIDKNRKLNLSNELMSWAENSKRKGMDVVSFTFTAPMTRSVSGSQTSREVVEKSNGFYSDYRSKKMLLDSGGTNSSRFSLGYNVIGGDALSTLLERKLKEFAHGVESSVYKTGMAGSTASTSNDFITAVKPVTTTPMLHDRRSEDKLYADEMHGYFAPGFPSTQHWHPRENHMPEGAEQLEECSSNDTDGRKLLDSRHPSPISVLEHSFLAESCNSSDTAESKSTEGSKQSSSVQAKEVLGTSSSRKFHLIEAVADLSDSASSISARTMAGKHVTVFSVKNYVGATKWELEYVKEILSSVELMFKDFALGRAREIITPYRFYLLESLHVVLERDGDNPKLNRKVLFDCVSECMDIRCRRYVGGGCTTWAKGLSVVRRKERLAEEVYREILGWKGMGDCMVDELVDKDMSSQYGRWLDFEVEAFELGVEIEGRILNSLLDEVVSDILPL
ncbi:unnamed protein product [Ilex paraguariensis]|uniref:DUF4378 domain-containing protein n=1 Tax=Ilex paraguariensis TaxID=185542 RepID=A0ABC8RM62_9AQUA